MHFFHLDAFSSSAHIKINLDTVLSVLASGCYRWLAKSLKGYETATARRLWETFIDRSGTIRLTDSEVIIRVRRFSRAPNLLPTMGYFTRQITNVVTDGFNLKTPPRSRNASIASGQRCCSGVDIYLSTQGPPTVTDGFFITFLFMNM